MIKKSEFDELLKVSKILHGENGCAWDKEQTTVSFTKHVKEETEELLEAIASKDTAHIREELGDAIWSLIFFAKLAEKENLFTIDEALKEVKEKIIRRHPHVFGDVKVSSVEEIMDNWERIKREEKEKKSR